MFARNKTTFIDLVYIDMYTLLYHVDLQQEMDAIETGPPKEEG